MEKKSAQQTPFLKRRKIPLLVRELAFCSAKQGGKFLCSSEDSHFAPQNKEEW